MPAPQRCFVCVFAKTPVAGRVKTRLASAIGPGDAAALAGAFLRDTWALVSSLPWAMPVLAHDDELDGAWRAALGAPRLVPQGQGDLGERLERVLGHALAEGAPAIAVGADSPGMPVGRLEAARRALGTHEAVIGHSDDGGFFLLGLRRCPPGLLADLPWSTAETGAHAEARLRGRGLRVARLRRWFDVDTPEDLGRLRAHLASPEGAGAAPHTREALSLLGGG